MLEYFKNLWSLFVDMSFYIVIGLIFTGLLHAFIKKEVILKHIGNNTTSSVVKASIFGIPLPLCSCGVVPTALYLGKNGASKGAVVSFLTSTPQTGIDSLIATYGMMGGLFAIYRAVTAFISGIFSGIVTNIFCKKDKVSFEVAKEEKHCCCNKAKEEVKEEKHCCCNKAKEKVKEEKIGIVEKLKIAFKYTFGEFLDGIAVHFVIGLLIAALISTLLPASILSNFSNPLITMIAMVLIGIPMYICSTASIPIAVSLMMKGISPGAAFVFLFAGPITNIASLTILFQTLGKKVTAVYLSCVAVCAISFGLILDFIIKITNYKGISNILTHTHTHGTPVYRTIIAILFGALVLKSLVKHFVKKA